MNKSNSHSNVSHHIKQIVLSGMLLAIAVALSFATFNIGGAGVYLVGIAVFLMPLCLKFPYMFVTALLSVFLADTIQGYMATTWISMIAYGGAVLIIWGFKHLRLSWFYMLGMVVGAGWAIASYYFMDLIMFDQAFAVKDVIATSIQFAIVVPTVSILYFPFKIVLKASNIITN